MEEKQCHLATKSFLFINVISERTDSYQFLETPPSSETTENVP